MRCYRQSGGEMPNIQRFPIEHATKAVISGAVAAFVLVTQQMGFPAAANPAIFNLQHFSEIQLTSKASSPKRTTGLQLAQGKDELLTDDKDDLLKFDDKKDSLLDDAKEEEPAKK